MTDSQFTWATVTQQSPLRIRLDGDSSALAFTPDSLVDPLALAVNDRVRCEIQNRRPIVLGVAGDGGASTTLRGLVELATDAETQAGTDAARVVTPASLTARTATTSRTGIAELATDAETQAGTDAARVITPASLAAHRGMATARASGTLSVAATGITTLTFPAGRFTNPPIVTFQAYLTGGLVSVVYTDPVPTATSVGVRVFTLGGAQRAGTVHWIAEED